MPVLQLRYAPAPGRSAPPKSQLAAAVEKATVSILRKKAERIATLVEAVPAEDWFVGGTALSRLSLGSFFLEIRLTDGTNSKAEKAAFVSAVFEAMAKLLGPLHPESYIHVVEVPADAFGYGGLTQEYRFVSEQIDAMELRVRSDRALAFGVR
ncbi:4-oxalocrotonate tautomerase [Hartmannibacter diazotrophicus]|uniref:4-oxalocrotonate tautomerase n=1 Tax=Hartmannibacter diazotrophicus TaxID=1482074 RepID=A0A2C9DCQ5_9HYPH|nr:tautomerase family protein [Hartmannibacter diazotrophicus]SON57959.1 4-oxalocrotonate tautomerase [Hartmannibacter diazotrophicus]